MKIEDESKATVNQCKIKKKSSIASKERIIQWNNPVKKFSL